MQLYLINPYNPLVSLADTKQSWWNRYRVWKPLGLLVIAALTPPEWEVTVFDENLGVPDYHALPKPDLVGITAFTSQANRAYDVADEFRQRGVSVVIGGIHATMCQDEARQHVDSIVTGEAESIWQTVLDDAKLGQLKAHYTGEHVDMGQVPPARHDLLSKGYVFGSIQTTRGCPLDCNFCSVSAFNGKAYRHRPIEDVIAEMRTIREHRVLVVDDNLIGTSRAHIERAKELFRAIIKAKLRKSWVAQVTINMADDDELLALAAKAGCHGVFIGFESPTDEGLVELGKRFNMLKERDFKASVKRIHRHGILVVGSLILGLDSDKVGIGTRIAAAANHYGVDMLNALFLTPLPGTQLWEQMESEGRIAANDFPRDWQYYTLGFPTAHYKNFSWPEILAEMATCNRRFYSRRQIAWRLIKNLLGRRRPLVSLASNLSYRNNARTTEKLYTAMGMREGCQESHHSSKTPRPAEVVALAAERISAVPAPKPL
jgi:radical SAM superfamily enzyme YgiQ (UPF0313 family)